MIKKMSIKFNLIVLVMVVFTSVVVAQVEETKKISKTFDVSDNASLEIENKYGKVHIITWDKQQVQLDIEILAKEKNQEKLDKLMASISFDINHLKGFIIAKTIISKGVINNGISELTNAIFSSENSLQIDYVIYVPQQISLTIDNKFGDVYIDKAGGKVVLRLSHGDLRSGGFYNDVLLDVQFGKTNINHFHSGRLLSSYADVDIKQVGKIDIDAKSSTINIEKVQSIKINSRRDKIYINEAESVLGEGSFSDFKIKKLTKEINLNTKYGDTYIDEIGINCTYINMNAKYTDLTLRLNPMVTYRLDMTNKSSDITFPLEVTNVETKNLDEDGKVKNIYGKIGKASDTKSNLVVNIENSNINIFYR